VLVNSNPATIMTDPGTADRTYIEPLNIERLEAIIAKERPDAILPNLGGQSALNLSSELSKTGVLEKYGVKVIGVQVDAIERGEDREAFKELMGELGIEMARSKVAYSVEEAVDIAKELGVKAYIADPVVVDEMDEVARYSGHPLFPRISIFHALNQKIIARQLAKDLGRKYEDMNIIAIHLGGGISVSAHKKGRVVDTNNALNGDGPFTPERAGSLPAGLLVDACFSGKYTKKEIGQMLKGKGGFVAYLGTNDALEVENAVKAGNKEWEKVYKAMAYQVAKEVGGLAASAMSMDVDAIFLTGGMAYDKGFCALVKSHVEKIAPVYVYPGEDEMKALALNGLRVLNGEDTPKVYQA
jgi:butyrate kinase